MRVDSHQHYWKVSRGDYHWMSADAPLLNRDYLPQDLRPLLSRHEIDQTIVVQAAQTVAETDFLLGLAGADDSIAGVVGWLDMDAPTFPQLFERYRKTPKFIGLRPMLQDIADDRWILRPRVLDSLRLIRDADFPFEFLSYPRHLPYVIEVLEQIPGLRAVIDHISKPSIRQGILEPWKSLMARAAEHKTLFCKLSGMVTEADFKTWRANDFRPYVEHVVACFGPDRLMFGSDWPVCLQASSYDLVIETAAELLSPLIDRDAEPLVFGENAVRFYKLDARTG